MHLSSFETHFLGLNEEEFVKLDAYSKNQRSVAYALIISTIFVHFVAVPLSSISIKIIFQTKLIHQNLKLILCCQYAFILYKAMLHLCFVAPVKFVTGDLFWSENEFKGQLLVEFLFSCPLFFQMICGHLIMLERLFATVCASRYEKRGGTIFSISWILFLICITMSNVYFKNVEENNEEAFVDGISVNGPAFGSTSFSLIASFLLSLITFGEPFLFIYLWHYNKTEYSGQFELSKVLRPMATANYQLSKQYQRLENIRTTRQLGPTLCIYFVIQLLTTFEQAHKYYFYAADEYPEEIIALSNQLAMALLNVVIEISIIIFHPNLRQNFIHLLKTFWPCVGHNRVAPPAAIELAGSGSREPRMSQQMENHFVMLAKIWEK